MIKLQEKRSPNMPNMIHQRNDVLISEMSTTQYWIWQSTIKGDLIILYIVQCYTGYTYMHIRMQFKTYDTLSLTHFWQIQKPKNVHFRKSCANMNKKKVLRIL